MVSYMHIFKIKARISGHGWIGWLHYVNVTLKLLIIQFFLLHVQSIWNPWFYCFYNLNTVCLKLSMLLLLYLEHKIFDKTGINYVTYICFCQNARIIRKGEDNCICNDWSSWWCLGLLLILTTYDLKWLFKF